MPVAQASDDDHERALRAMESGQIKPLADILKTLAQVDSGRVVEVELEQKRGRWIYEIKLIQSNGLVRKLKVDAVDARVLSSKHDD